MARLSNYICILVFFTLCCQEAKSIGGPVSVTQSAPKTVVSGKDFVIELTVKKEGTESFAKIQQPLPRGFSAEAVLSAEAQFSFEEQTVKFIWDKLPEANEFSVSYKITIDAMMVGLMKIGGVFAFVKNEDRVLIEIGSIEIDVRPPEVVAAEIVQGEPPVIVEEKADPTEEEAQVVAVLADEDVAKERPKPSSAPVTKETRSYTYKIQIAAAYGEIGIDVLARKYGISDPISEEIHNKMNKYTVGSFDTYSDAKLYLNTVLATFSVQGAFITAYQGKLRITVNQTFK